MKFRSVGAEFYEEGQADETKLIVAFRSCAKALRNLLVATTTTTTNIIII